MYSIRRSQAGYQRLAVLAALWRQGFFYADDTRIRLSSVERPDLDASWILTTDDRPTANEIRDILEGELS